MWQQHFDASHSMQAPFSLIFPRRAAVLVYAVVHLLHKAYISLNLTLPIIIYMYYEVPTYSLCVLYYCKMCTSD